MENKWLMFKNYMHNELGITKEDIRQWIEDAVREQAEKLVKNEFNNFDVRNVVQRIITDERYFGSKNLKQEISQELTRQILTKIKFE
jgi:hypothetical protein